PASQTAGRRRGMVAVPGAGRLSGGLDPGSFAGSPWLAPITRHRIDLLTAAIACAGSVSTKEREDTLTRWYTLLWRETRTANGSAKRTQRFEGIECSCRLRRLRVRLSRHDLDLDGRAERQRGGLNCCPGRIGCLEMTGVSRVHRAEILHVREIDSGFHHVV